MRKIFAVLAALICCLSVWTSVPVAAAVLVNRGISFYFLLILSGIFSIVLGRMDRKSKSKMKVKLEKY